MTSTLDFTVSL